ATAGAAAISPARDPPIQGFGRAPNVTFGYADFAGSLCAARSISRCGGGVLRLQLRVGDRVRVRPLDDILATLDETGCLDALPFMPEMARACGREFVVHRSAHKVNDLVDRTGLRRMDDAVVLVGERCDGSRHGGCEARCQSLWKDAWLERADAAAPTPPMGRAAGSPGVDTRRRAGCTEQDLLARCRADAAGGERFICQQTELKKASSELAWWNPRQYFRDWRSGNVAIGDLARAFGFWLFCIVAKRVGGYRLLVGAYDAIQARRGAPPFPYRDGRLRKTPSQVLNLQPGERVKVKAFAEILETLDTSNKNRGLWFDAEMVRYCGGTYSVLARVQRIIDPKSGQMLRFGTPSVILDNVTTLGDYHRFYPQNEYPFWREIWLQRC
ncbi:MAG TPA: hypothetical protein VFU71_03065, partial [Burkholderiaceae bacterium]|nr:hypothetical protein [Burkholderiaceae bacterium]